ncbi:MAG: hypothetical protein A3I66_22835 [Burkholderiales bacterium RIFCSPLOWO2_02_FULL_57_36]|nr:MAG: hypothetical protein A3I66_22835 [Burkholderiales bacterium RIFCSPLOWO2_02_FULL_57_36]
MKAQQADSAEETGNDSSAQQENNFLVGQRAGGGIRYRIGWIHCAQAKTDDESSPDDDAAPDILFHGIPFDVDAVRRACLQRDSIVAIAPASFRALTHSSRLLFFWSVRKNCDVPALQQESKQKRLARLRQGV